MLDGWFGVLYVFIVIDVDEVFKSMVQDVCEVVVKVNFGLQVVQLYCDYLFNFMINKNQDCVVVLMSIVFNIVVGIQGVWV